MANAPGASRPETGGTPEAPGEFAPGFLRGRDIVCVSATRWDQNWLSNHQYMSRLAQRNRVLYIEKPRNLLSVIGQALSRSERAGSGTGSSGVRPVSDSLLVATPGPVLPMRFETPIIHLNQFALRRWLRTLLSRYGFTDIILWSFAPDACFLHGHLGEALGIYFITDDHASYRGSRNREAAIRRWERRLVAKADIVFATSRELVDMKRVDNPRTFYAPHGVDADLFAQTLSPATAAAGRLARITQPVVGYVGLLNCRIDVGLVAECARRRPGWDFVLIGPRERGFDAASLDALPNVWLFERCERQDLPRHLKKFDVGFIPYLVDSHTRYLHPLKALEYLAAGLPVVATELPALHDYREQVAVVSGAAEAVAALDEAMRANAPQLRRQRSHFARQHTWDRRLADLEKTISTIAAPGSAAPGGPAAGSRA